MTDVDLSDLCGLRVGPGGVALAMWTTSNVRTSSDDKVYHVWWMECDGFVRIGGDFTGRAVMERWPHAIPIGDGGWEMLMLLAGGRPSPIATELSEADRERLKVKVQAIREAGSRMLAYAADFASALELPAPVGGIS